MQSVYYYSFKTQNYYLFKCVRKHNYTVPPLWSNEAQF